MLLIIATRAVVSLAGDTVIQHTDGRNTFESFRDLWAMMIGIASTKGPRKLLNINIYKTLIRCQGFVQKFFSCLGRSMRFAELEFSVKYCLVQAPPSGGGSNDPRPAVSVPQIDTDGCRARQARSCKNTAFRGGI